MPVDAIGSALSSGTSDVSRTTLSQEDFVKLFMTELTFQDPLEPINNREFLAQMAQFANLEQARVANENTGNLLVMDSASQALGLLNRQVQVTTTQGTTMNGTVSAISFSSGGPLLTVTSSSGAVVTDVRLSQVGLVRP